MDYITTYKKLIEKAQARKELTGYFEIHHIVPRSLGGSNAKENLVNLTAREHLIAHLLLARVYGGGMWNALVMLNNTRLSGPRLNSRSYEKARIEFSKKRSEQMSGSGNPMFGISLAGEKNGMWGKGHLLVGKNNGRFISPIIATEIATQKQIIFVGRKELQDFGFNDSKVYACLNGKRNKHKGYTFAREQI